jgi:tRNA uridine 5-carboxymethylaminomethyl modification enzyme
VVELILDSSGSTVQGVLTERGRRFTAKTVVLTTGTFMEGKIFIGEFSLPSGRLGEPAAIGLGKNLREIGFTVGRLKTGTPARVARHSIDFSQMTEQPGDDVMLPFSFQNDEVNRPAVSCYITYTNEKTHSIIRNNIHRSPLYGGQIEGVGPRYCPSIEDKVVRFPDRNRHQIFVEPEGLQTEEMYLNGISSSLPEEVQEQFLKTMPGLKDVVVMRPGYAVEYDFIDPTQLFPSLETKRAAGLFVAGQTNGTSGYEEAAGQGLLAGINAALKMEGKPPLVLSRAEAYIGVLIVVLVTLVTKVPYLMFTSRAEYRLQLRHDASDRRLFEKGLYAGLLSKEAEEKFREKQSGIEEIKELLHQRRMTEKDLEEGENGLPEHERVKELFEKHTGKTFLQVLKDPEVSIEDLLPLEESLSIKRQEWLRQSELDIKYEGYIQRQERQVQRFKKMEEVKIPPNFDYSRAEGLSAESKEKLETIRPISLGQASRISGVRSSDIAVLLVLLRR